MTVGAQPVAASGPAPASNGVAAPQAAEPAPTEGQAAVQGGAAPAPQKPAPDADASARAKWAAERVQTERQMREQKRLLEEREQELADLREKAKAGADPVAALMAHPERHKLYREIVKQLAADDAPEPTETDKLRQELEELKADRKSRLDAEQQAQQKAADEKALGVASKMLEEAAERFPLLREIGGAQAIVNEYRAMHAAGRRPDADEVMEAVHEKIHRNLDEQVARLVKVPAFQKLLLKHLPGEQTPTRQANEGDDNTERGNNKPDDSPIRALTNALSAQPAEHIDWDEVSTDDVREMARRKLRKQMGA